MRIQLPGNHQRLLASLLIVFFLGACAQAVPVSGFKPVSPKLYEKADSLRPTLAWEPFPGSHEVPLVMQEMVDIPRLTKPIDVQNGLLPYRRWPLVEVDARKVSDVTYDLRVWEAIGTYQNGRASRRADLVYEREKIKGTRHRVKIRLKPDTNYVWTVRARFRLDGKPRVSEWSIVMHSGLESSQYPKGCYSYLSGNICTPRYVARIKGDIPTNFLYRFKTPEIQAQ